MSSMLGPIHERMFQKAVAVDGLARAIAAYADAQGWTSGHAAELDAVYPPLAGNITDHIDLAQIHASLNVLVNNSENALAAAVEPLGEHRDEINAFVQKTGFAAGTAFIASTTYSSVDLQQVWNAMDLAWLDGMPCDRMVSFSRNDGDCISWNIALEPHPAKGYAQLRSAWMKGFCKALPIAFETVSDGAYAICKAA